MTTTGTRTPDPDWDLEQLEVILEDAGAWQLITAGPGTGKSAVACRRVAYLIDEGIPSARILMVSFTRTAIAELRNRIISYSIATDQARHVRISTIDSHAWSLREGFDDKPFAFARESYDINIERAVQLFAKRQPDLMDFMQRLEHLVVDEAQDVVGVRAKLIIEMLQSLSPECGVTILADPAQAIYGFTTEDEEEAGASATLLGLLDSSSPRKLLAKNLKDVHRIQNPQLVEVFDRTRKEIEQAKDPNRGHVKRVQDTIRETCGNDFGTTQFKSLASLLGRPRDGSTLVLFRHRAEVIMASSFCSECGVEHSLRMSGTPTIVSPWLGWLFWDVRASFVSRDEFSQLWSRKAAIEQAPFQGLELEGCWNVLHRLAAGKKQGTVDLVQLRQIISRARPPVELCLPECGTSGPILGTIHASKGREADTVILVTSSSSSDAQGDWSGDEILEEGRVYYVGATRARRMLIAVANTDFAVRYLESRRIFRLLGGNRVQIEVGRPQDVDSLAHLNWTDSSDIQRILASSVGKVLPMHAQSFPELNYATRLMLPRHERNGVTTYACVGEMSQDFQQDLWNVSNILDSERGLKPPEKIPHLYLSAVTSIGLDDEHAGAVRQQFNLSRMALAPVIKGFPTLRFFHRRSRRSWI